MSENRSMSEVFKDVKKLFEYICGNDQCAVGKLNELLEELVGAMEARVKDHSDKLEDAAQQYIAEYCAKASRDKNSEYEAVEQRMLNTVQEASEKFAAERLHEDLTDENREAIALLVKEALDVSKADVQRDITDSRVEAFNKLYEEIHSIKDDENLSGSIPLNRERAEMVVGVLSRMPIGKVESFVDDMYKHSEGWSLHFAKEDDVWEITSATKIKDLTLLGFIRNYRFIVDFSKDSKLSMNKFNQLCQKMFDNFKLDHPDQFPKDK